MLILAFPSHFRIFLLFPRIHRKQPIFIVSKDKNIPRPDDSTLPARKATPNIQHIKLNTDTPTFTQVPDQLLSERVWNKTLNPTIRDLALTTAPCYPVPCSGRRGAGATSVLPPLRDRFSMRPLPDGIMITNSACEFGRAVG